MRQWSGAGHRTHFIQIHLGFKYHVRRFYSGVLLLAAFEIANVFFIMPMPGSQSIRSLGLAYALYECRWIARVAAAILIVSGVAALWRRGGLAAAAASAVLVSLAALTYVLNFRMSADHMFIAPEALNMQPAERNAVERNRLVVGIELDGQARAYPVQFIGYHHQVRDTVGGQPIMVSFCTVCRTGRVFRPEVMGKSERFRLVGMDHFNAMFEDETTGSWWRQASGEAITGPLKGTQLVQVPSVQVALSQWLALHPKSLIMQADSTLRAKYSQSFDFETGASRSALTGTDSASWHEKSWVVGITAGGASKAYDWNRLRRERAINDVVGPTPVVIALGEDDASFVAFERPSRDVTLSLRNDSLVSASTAYDFAGRGANHRLKPVQASQEFWHSWRTFQPATTRY